MLSPIVAGVWRMASWNWSPTERLRWIEQCLELGVTSFDHADIYGGYTVETLFGEALALAPSLRQRMQLVTKCGIQLRAAARPATRIKHYDTSARHIVHSVEQSLMQLRTDSIDLLLLHRPDPLMDADEVAAAFEQLRRQGKVQAFGVSNYTPAQFELLHARTPLVTNQVECHPLHRAPLFDGTFDQAQRLRARPMIWSPLAGGALFSSEAEEAMRVRGVLTSIGAQYGVSAATIAFAWLMRLPSKPYPIAGSRRIEAMAEAVAATRISLEVQEWTEILTAATGTDVP
ncbi:aldo/keto reductase [Gemmatimonas sp.]|jgi:predicted oxidoreductase|uniref:aldo/keto reductase n=1 Tax=Gemmatimonas sp. TaxID=1962908 RepID=UPI0022BE5DCE|nr:aldo/keto reductase [Gemmatimonas sp.]MCZ8206275.1 aldo/keto reductase [Gemmatimonas sp.]